MGVAPSGSLLVARFGLPGSAATWLGLGRQQLGQQDTWDIVDKASSTQFVFAHLGMHTPLGYPSFKTT